MFNWVPNRHSFINMEKKSFENFRQYAQRWREEVAQVHLSLTEKEMIVMFIGTLRAPYYKRLEGSAIKNFIDMVISGEIIENAIKSSRISVKKASGLVKKNK